MSEPDYRTEVENAYLVVTGLLEKMRRRPLVPTRWLVRAELEALELRIRAFVIEHELKGPIAKAPPKRG